MDHKEELAVLRRAYAKQVLAAVGVNDPRVEAAFAAVEREHFLGPGPWQVLRYSGYVPTPNADPTYLYCDVLIGIVPERGLNNGMPSYHAPAGAHGRVLRGGGGANLHEQAGRAGVLPWPHRYRCTASSAARMRERTAAGLTGSDATTLARRSAT
jgi:protein-L-isoaspartate(D-aspartate) O-methyltransferase